MRNLASLRAPRQGLLRRARARVYLAAPKSEYETPRYRRLAAHAKQCFPRAELIEARTVFEDVWDWREHWPDLLQRITVLVFCTTPDGWVGRGVWTEIHTARPRVPVYYLTDQGALVPFSGLSFSRPNPDDWTRHVRVRVRKVGLHVA